VAELVHGFIIPETQKEVHRQSVRLKQEPFLIAAHKELYNETNKVISKENSE